DAIAEKLDVKVSQEEFTQYLIQSAGQYGMAPQEFIQAIQQGGQLPALMGDVARNKALSIVLGKVEVVDTNGDVVDVSDFVLSEDEDVAEEPAEADETQKDDADKAE